MKTIAQLGLTTLVIIALLFSCKKADYASGEAAADSQTTDSTAVSSSAAVEKKDSKQKFIRTADIKFKVKNVVKRCSFSVHPQRIRQTIKYKTMKQRPSLRRLNFLPSCCDDHLQNRARREVGTFRRVLGVTHDFVHSGVEHPGGSARKGVH